MIVSDEGSEKKVKPPIVHEVMHIVSMTTWGVPPGDNKWLNEGLATYAQNNCSGYSVSEIYRYLLAEDMLAPIEALAFQFHQVVEMVAYHQSAYIVEYLIVNHGLEKFEGFWRSGFSSFESIYGSTYDQMQTRLHKQLIETFPDPPNIDWDFLI